MSNVRSLSFGNITVLVSGFISMDSSSYFIATLSMRKSFGLLFFLIFIQILNLFRSKTKTTGRF
jgi:hypothetical protein